MKEELEAEGYDPNEVIKETLDFLNAILPHIRKMGEYLYPDGIPFGRYDESIEAPFE